MTEPAVLKAFDAFFKKLDNTCTQKLHKDYTYTIF